MGRRVGCLEGLPVGCLLGRLEGWPVGCLLGCREGWPVGWPEGILVVYCIEAATAGVCGTALANTLDALFCRVVLNVASVVLLAMSWDRLVPFVEPSAPAEN